MGSGQTAFLAKKAQSRPFKNHQVKFLICEPLGNLVLLIVGRHADEFGRRDALRLIVIVLALSGCDGSSIFEYGSSTLVRDVKFEVFKGEGTFILHESSDFVISSPASVDYTALMESVGGEIVNKGRINIRVFRSSNYVRQDFYQYGLSSSTISDLKSGASYRLWNEHNERTRLLAYGPLKSQSVTVYKTKRRDKILGENCDIWSFDKPPIYSDKCLTSDGVVLWQKQFGKGGTVAQFYRAVSLTRRPVKSDEILPSDLRNWDSWVGKDVEPASLPNDKVVLQGLDWRGGWNMRVIRRLGENISDKASDRNGARWTMKWRGADILFQADERGNPLELRISRADTNPQAVDLITNSQAVIGSESIQNYKCFWREMSHSEGHYRECRSLGGILLKSSYLYISDLMQLTARSVSVGALTEDDLRPPSNWLKFGFWTKPIVEIQHTKP